LEHPVGLNVFTVHSNQQAAPITLHIFYIRGSVHHNSRLKKSNKMQLYRMNTVVWYNKTC